MKDKLLIVDLDGTLFDTKEVNYFAYKDALNEYGYEIDYKYFCDFCNGRHYTEFLPSITTYDKDILLKLHNLKQAYYEKYLTKARLNVHLTNIIKSMSAEYFTAIVTTASKKNCYEILDAFSVTDLFDLILTKEDIINTKPNPEGFLLAMKRFNIKPDDTIIFEDSSVGVEGAKNSGANYVVVKGFN